ncbi:hypothetical protein Q9L58_001099 [Maublancomyces gigas]|uniref:Uncharacterized protein n=1 Tax=Discina gigas TaxID=1032678 RepID=A0ABR3GV14_9PEZI
MYQNLYGGYRGYLSEHLPRAKVSAYPGYGGGALPTQTTNYVSVNPTATVTEAIPPETFYFPTTFPSIATITSSINWQEERALAARRRWCPDWPEIWDGIQFDDLNPECSMSWSPYCEPVVTGSILPSPTNIPTTCYPELATTYTEDIEDEEMTSVPS